MWQGNLKFYHNFKYCMNERMNECMNEREITEVFFHSLYKNDIYNSVMKQVECSTKVIFWPYGAISL